MTNVLIPTDFTTQSLELVNSAAQYLPGKLNVFLFHTFDMPDTLIDAMHMNGVKNHSNLITEELRLKCRQIKADNPAINSISFRLMFGTTVAVFKNFAEANNIDVIIYPTGYKYIPVVRESINPDRMFLRSGIAVMRNLSPKHVPASIAAKAYATQSANEEMVLHG